MAMVIMVRPVAQEVRHWYSWRSLCPIGSQASEDFNPYGGGKCMRRRGWRIRWIRDCAHRIERIELAWKLFVEVRGA
jgi:hypothetical protein